jgi:hypothetical protein
MMSVPAYAHVRDLSSGSFAFDFAIVGLYLETAYQDGFERNAATVAGSTEARMNADRKQIVSC